MITCFTCFSSLPYLSSQHSKPSSSHSSFSSFCLPLLLSSLSPVPQRMKNWDSSSKSPVSLQDQYSLSPLPNPVTSSPSFLPSPLPLHQIIKANSSFPPLLSRFDTLDCSFSLKRLPSSHLTLFGNHPDSNLLFSKGCVSWSWAAFTIRTTRTRGSNRIYSPGTFLWLRGSLAWTPLCPRCRVTDCSQISRRSCRLRSGRGWRHLAPACYLIP